MSQSLEVRKELGLSSSNWEETSKVEAEEDGEQCEVRVRPGQGQDHSWSCRSD